MDIQPLTNADVSGLLALWQTTEGLTLRDVDTPGAIERYLERNPGFSFAAWVGGVLVGGVLCGHDGRRGYLHHLAVHPDHRRRGIGRALVHACLNSLAVVGIDKCHLFVRTDNPDARAFWQHLGWQQRADIEVFSFISSGRPGA